MTETTKVQSLQELHDRFYGAQDKYDTKALAKCNQPRYNFNVKETRTFTYDSPYKRKKFRHTLSLPYDFVNEEGKKPNSQYKGEAYTNFKITPSSAIYDISLEVGGQKFNRPVLSKFLNKDIEINEMSNGHALPALGHHTNDIFFETDCEGQVTISYDVITHENPDEVSESMVYGEQFTGTETITSKFSKIHLPYNHPIVEIYAFLPPNTIDARILLDGEDHNLVLTKKDNYYHIEFGNETSINFSRIDRPVLQLKLEEDGHYEVNVVGIYKSIVRRMSGMAGLAFSK